MPITEISIEINCSVDKDLKVPGNAQTNLKYQGTVAEMIMVLLSAMSSDPVLEKVVRIAIHALDGGMDEGMFTKRLDPL